MAVTEYSFETIIDCNKLWHYLQLKRRDFLDVFFSCVTISNLVSPPVSRALKERAPILRSGGWSAECAPFEK